MKMIIVTVRHETEKYTYDMEVPTQEPVRQLKEDIAETLKSYRKHTQIAEASVRLYCERLKKILQDAETLEQAGVWNGDVLVLKP